MNYRNYFFVFGTSLIFSLFIQSPFAIADSSVKTNLQWSKFKANSSILGFTLGESTVDQVIQKMGGDTPTIPEKQHELVEICFKHYGASQYITFLTGKLHDYSRLYTFEVSTNISKSLENKCKQYNPSKGENLRTDGGLYLGQTKDEVLSILGYPSNKTSLNWIWEFENYTTYKEPKISFAEAGPSNSRYMMKFIVKGAYEYGTISIKFVKDRLFSFAVDYFAESDFKIEHYDINTGKPITR
jgi:hypothetical protein